ncbi:uncharacterized protein LOC129746490 [Uranotaenia lowii]|uniref:uncharacterized protein LOC129746490 n=1 Tax=Uranotaenia lowii TaxID=190385 RepID=UPI002479CC13|nr:uncharacterized protein LOC129746490 [Uranotaenia lowii]
MRDQIVPYIDNSPPILFVDNILHSTKLVHDIRRLREISKDNKELLKRINRINRTRGFLGVNYDYDPKVLVRYEARISRARRIETENLNMLERILNAKPQIKTSLQLKSYYQQLKYIKSKYFDPKSIKAAEKHIPQIEGVVDANEKWIMEFCESNHRVLGSIQIVPNGSEFLGQQYISTIRGQIYRIYKNQFAVIRGQISATDGKEDFDTSTARIERGSLLKITINDQPAILLTLAHHENISNYQLLARADCEADMLDLLNEYGTAYGRMVAPICYRLRKKKIY